MILVLTYALVALLIGLYVAWFLWRYRREQRSKAMESERPSPSGFVGRDADPISSSRRATAPSTPAPGPVSQTAPPLDAFSSTGGGARTVAEALAGISMPHDLVPLTSIAPRPGVIDQVAFASKAPASVVGPLFADELERLGYGVKPLDEQSLAATRGNDNLVVYIHPEPSAPNPDVTVVIEVCVPY